MMFPIKRPKLFALLGIVFIIGIDQWSKALILEYFFRPRAPITITSFFDLVLVWNHGVSFGMFNAPSRWNVYILSTFAVAISCLLLKWLWQAPNYLLRVGFGLIIAGAIGNVFDRLRFSAVVDFLHFHWGNYAFPTFNIADTAITLGVCFVLIDNFKNSRETTS
ncbi:MAG: signal peptidase II [Candidatus Paracaedimonas acanthamoebae]|uniref:Lipoprotein signal peptidase n=1 Tax=Candidatus Paracaedimonas acanthamoebae TaxID=244581 RepID=A0A8J7PWE1_9PROT|nr:signal peptidase II [Candidatus Paracaedimonas acanthamoebae]